MIRKNDALEYHRAGRPGKLEVVPTKPLVTQRDLSLAYSPGVAEPCLEIAANPEMAWEYTARGNLVAVVTNGTAVLGLGNIGPLAGKPVMEGKACLFKKFADIDVFDLEVDARDSARFIDVVAALEPTFGGINLEDLKAPECFEIEAGLRARMAIPVFHDDQHGTAIISGAALLNGAEITGKKLADLKIVVSGAGASAIACANFYVSLGVSLENITMVDSVGRDLRGARAGDEPVEGAVRAPGRRRPHARRCAARRRPVPGPVEGGALHGRDAEDDGAAAARLRAGQPRSRDRLRRGEGGAARRHRRHRAQRLSQPGQQRPRLPLRLPRRARRARQGDQRGDEDRRRARAGRAGARAGARLASPRPTTCSAFQLRPRLHHPQAVRHARALVVRAGGGRGGDEVGRRAADARPRRVPRAAAAPHRRHAAHDHAPDRAAGEERAQADRLPRRRQHQGAARLSDRARRADRAPHPARPRAEDPPARRRARSGSRGGGDHQPARFAQARRLRHRVPGAALPQGGDRLQRRAPRQPAHPLRHDDGAHAATPTAWWPA